MWASKNDEALGKDVLEGEDGSRDDLGSRRR
jgi:hypothetical protein